MSRKKAIILGAGPAGLTAAYEFLSKTDIEPIVFEKDALLGGISRTVNYKGNRIDIGGHRFFSKSQKVVSWWTQILPLQTMGASDDIALGRIIDNPDRTHNADPQKTDKVMLIRSRISRIYAFRKFFDYPISLSMQTISNLGLPRMARIGLSYLKVKIFPVKQERTLEDFLISRFGRELYRTFFQSYTQKVWGVPCHQLSAQWGAQRIKGLSITKALVHAIGKILGANKDISSKKQETSLIERFMYPKLGPGQLWEEVARRIQDKGAMIHMEHEVVGIRHQGQKVTGVCVRNLKTGDLKDVEGDVFISSVPVRELIAAMSPPAPEEVRRVSDGLIYRDFITVGLLIKELAIKNQTRVRTLNNIVPDNWIYIQEDDVRIGRVQVFNNWSPYMVADVSKVWLGLEYFCNEGDDLWCLDDEKMKKLACQELVKIGFIKQDPDVLDGVVLRVPKAYPSYFGTYNEFDTIRRFTDTFENLYLVGRNGMHRYNNADHSMMTAMLAVESIAKGSVSREAIWSVNMEKDYQEEASEHT